MEPTEIADLASSKWIKLYEVVEQTALAFSTDLEDAKRILNKCGLSEVRPISVVCTFDGRKLDPPPDLISFTITVQLDDFFTLDSIPDAVRHLIHDSDFRWEIHQLVYWFKEKKWDIPKKWQEWMKSGYPILEERKLLDHPISKEGWKRVQNLKVENGKPVIDEKVILPLEGQPPLSESSASEEHEGNKGNFASSPKGDNLPRKTSHPLAIFQSMDNLKFQEIKICFDRGNPVLRISARGKKATVPFSAIEITKKNEITLNRQGVIFRDIVSGYFNAKKRGATRAISRLSKSLRDAFDTQDQPFLKMKPQFQRSILKDRDAQRRAIKKSVTYRDDIHACKDTGVQAQLYLQDHDLEFDRNDPIYSDDPDQDADY